MSKHRKGPSSPVVTQTAPAEGPGKGSPANRRKTGQFAPGASGNPTGRPKVVEAFKARARKAVDEHVLERWIQEVVTDGPEWMRASENLAAYGYGKPSSAPEDLDAVREGGGAALAQLTREDLLRVAKLPVEEE